MRHRRSPGWLHSRSTAPIHRRWRTGASSRKLVEVARETIADRTRYQPASTRPVQQAKANVAGTGAPGRPRAGWTGTLLLCAGVQGIGTAVRAGVVATGQVGVAARSHRSSQVWLA
jgi:hypothetical protein